MTKDEIFEELCERELLEKNQHIILVDGFEKAFLGVTAEKPVKSLYDYWMCLDILIQEQDLDFDEAMDVLEEFVQKDLGKHSPSYIKIL